MWMHNSIDARNPPDHDGWEGYFYNAKIVFVNAFTFPNICLVSLEILHLNKALITEENSLLIFR